jgi:hypothetical protein
MDERWLRSLLHNKETVKHNKIAVYVYMKQNRISFITTDFGHLMGSTEEATLDVFQDYRHQGQHISS